jgi:hypothetical protein
LGDASAAGRIVHVEGICPGHLRDEAACVAALAKARTQIEQFGPDSDPRWSYWVAPAWITAGAGDCLLRLGQPGQATVLLNDGIALFEESFARERLIYLTHLSEALARPGKHCGLDAAVERGLAAVRLAETLISTRGIECLRDLNRQMQPHASVSVVGDFLEQLRAVGGVMARLTWRNLWRSP